uniref:Uncharacterized protein n=1 Tax=Ciona savignyi TaxID=51511 RepID=H2YDZ2_CIOSA
MDIEVTGLQQLPEELSKVSSTVFWRADDQDISTALFKATPDIFLATVVRKGGISAALCYVIFRTYPETSVSNFRQLRPSQIIFTVDQEGRFIDDVRTGIATRKLNTALHDLSSLFDNYFDIYKTCPLVFELYRPSSNEYVSSPPQYRKKEEEHNSEKISSGVAASHISVTEKESTTTNFDDDDIRNFLNDENGTDLFARGQYKDALPFLQTSLKSTTDQFRAVLLLKVALCLRACNRETESNSTLAETLKFLEKQSTVINNHIQYAEKIRIIGCCYRKEKAFSKSVIIFSASATIFSQSSVLINATRGMANCMTDMKRVADDNCCSSGCKDLVRKMLKRNLDKLDEMTKCGDQAKAL